MVNQDIQQVAKLADACLLLASGSNLLNEDNFETSMQNWVLACKETVSSMGASEQVKYLKATFNLNNAELTALCLLVLPYANSEYLDFFSNLQGDEQQRASWDTLSNLVTTTYQDKSALLSKLETNSALILWGLVKQQGEGVFAFNTVVPSPQVIAFLTDEMTEPSGDLITLCKGSPLSLPIDANIKPSTSKLQLIRGGFEERQLTVAINLSRGYYQQPLYRLNADILKSKPDMALVLREVLVFVTLQNGILYWQNGLEDMNTFPTTTACINDWVKLPKSVLLLGEMQAVNLPPTLNPFDVSTIALEPLSKQMEETVWQSMGTTLLGNTSIDWAVVNNTYTLNMERLGQTLMRQKQNSESGVAPSTLTLQDCYVSTSPLQLADIAYRDEVYSSFTDMVLGDATLKQLKSVHDAYLNRSFTGEKKPTGVMAIFEGDSGTGKTMAAESLCDALKLPLYRMDYSMIENIAENNLQRLFEEAEMNSAALLFDEADALFGNPKNNPSQQNANNLLRAFLIQQIETHPGLVLLTTSAKQKIAPDFIRRANRVITFQPLTPQQRFTLFQKIMSTKGIKIESTVNLSALVQSLPLTGRNISNIINNAILSAKSGTVPLQDIIIAANNLEQAIKQEIK